MNSVPPLANPGNVGGPARLPEPKQLPPCPNCSGALIWYVDRSKADPDQLICIECEWVAPTNGADPTATPAHLDKCRCVLCKAAFAAVRDAQPRLGVHVLVPEAA